MILIYSLTFFTHNVAVSSVLQQCVFELTLTDLFNKLIAHQIGASKQQICTIFNVWVQ